MGLQGVRKPSQNRIASLHESQSDPPFCLVTMIKTAFTDVMTPFLIQKRAAKDKKFAFLRKKSCPKFHQGKKLVYTQRRSVNRYLTGEIKNGKSDQSKGKETG
ncbi:MAG: hypothetical protein ACK4E7_02770 [Permianibacter sp.]